MATSSQRFALIEAIERAFHTVQLEDGVGIFEAEALDSCRSDKLLAKARKEDARIDWKKISDSVIESHYFALCFMDQKGLRFAIPAYMRFSLKHFETSSSASVDAPIYALARCNQWDLLSSNQNQVTAKFLEFMTLHGKDFVDTWQASLAYEEHWCKFA